MTRSRSLFIILACSLVLAACGQQLPAPSAAGGTAPESNTGGGPAALRHEGGSLGAASAACNVVPNQSGWCSASAPLSQYRFFVQCYDGGYANRIVTVYGVWRNNGGTYRSYATCAAGDQYRTWGFEWR